MCFISFIFIYRFSFHCFIVYPSKEIPSSGWRCSASSSLNNEKTCKNVYTETGSWSWNHGWVTDGIGEGSWIKIDFHESIRISKIVYRNNQQRPGKCCNQNFKDISFQFSDGTTANATVDDVFETDLHYRVYPPKVSNYLLLTVISVHNHYKAGSGFEKAEYVDNYFGIANIRLFGENGIEKGNYLIVNFDQKLCIT